MNEPVHSPRRVHPKTKTPAKQASRTNDPQRTMAGILSVATAEFANKGFSGARIDDIAAETHTSKRMIYYYFGSKEGLYIAVLEEAYRLVRAVEGAQSLDDFAPDEALRRLVGFTFDHHHSHPDYIRLVMTENMERGAYMAQSRLIQQVNMPAIDTVRRLYDRGVADGLFRTGLDAIDIHASISALAFFNVSNQYTFGLIFKRDFHAPEAIAARRAAVIDMIERFVRK